VAKPRRCPHCDHPIPIDTGYRFDENLNMVCNNCNKVVIPVAAEFEESKTEVWTGTGYSTPHGQRNWADPDAYD